MKQVLLEREHQTTVLVEDVTKEKGYIMNGKKGDYVLGRDTKGKFIWVRVTPGKTTKPVHAYNTAIEAVRDKLSKGYDVFEYTNVNVD